MKGKKLVIIKAQVVANKQTYAGKHYLAVSQSACVLTDQMYSTYGSGVPKSETTLRTDTILFAAAVISL